MLFQTPLTIKQIMYGMNRKHFLPAIQREFVWKDSQIIKLFDSILLGYPIGSFLFWRVDQENLKKFEFYEFIRDFHEVTNRHNKKANLLGMNEIEAILDGQQRLTSLFIGLRGTYTVKKRYTKSKYPEKKLYINLRKMNDNIDDTETVYDIQFLDNPQNDESKFWFEFGKILEMETTSIMRFVMDNKLEDVSLRILSSVYEAVNRPLINYYLETSNELHKVLNIFVRVNSGGTQLSYSDLLLSIATASWKKLDAREEIYKFVDEINTENFNINKDFVLKTALYILDKDIKFKVDNFDSKTMGDIENNWDKIKEAIKSSFEILKYFGYTINTLSSNYPATVVAYYLYKNNLSSSRILSDHKYLELLNSIKIFVLKSILKQLYSSSLDTILAVIRKSIVTHGFNVDLINKDLPANKKLLFSDEEIKELMELQYGDKQTYSILSILYPNLNYLNNFHLDHIFPISRFKELEYSNLFECANSIVNLQFLEGLKNIMKSNTMPEEWIDMNYPSCKEKYKEDNYIEPNKVLEIEKFKEYYDYRYMKIITELQKVLK